MKRRSRARLNCCGGDPLPPPARGGATAAGGGRAGPGAPGRRRVARLADRIGSGTMSLYRHVANKDELVVFMLSAAPGPPPDDSDRTNWRGALSNWAGGLWDVYHRHPWILQAAASGPPAHPGPVAWLGGGAARV